jgi:hypothetical protein
VRRLTVPIGPNGALLQVEIGVSALYRAALHREGKTQPASVKVDMLVDTGASHTFVGAANLKSLGISPRNTYRFHSASTQDTPELCDEYDVSLILGSLADQNVWRFDLFRIMATDRLSHRSHGLLGRDVLDSLQLDWNGPGRSLVLLYP